MPTRMHRSFQNWPADAGVWSLRFHWTPEKFRLHAEFHEGRDHFE